MTNHKFKQPLGLCLKQWTFAFLLIIFLEVNGVVVHMPALTWSIAQLQGAYFTSSGFNGITIDLLEDSTFEFSSWFDVGGLDRPSTGTYALENGLLVLSFESFGDTFDSKHSLRRTRTLKMLPIKWGPRRYLIPTESVQQFCNAILNKLEPASPERSRFFWPIQSGSENFGVLGYPMSPQGRLCITEILTVSV